MRDEQVGEFGNAAHRKQGLTCWREVGWWGSTSQMRIYSLKGRKMEEWADELGNVAHCKRGLTNWREEEGGGSSGLAFQDSRMGDII